MYIPATPEETDALGWDKLDVILVTGDAYIDVPSSGVAIIGHVLMNAGFRVGIISQPDVSSPEDIKRLGEPRLFWGVTSGAVDSTVSNYTSLRKKRNSDDLTPGGINNRRPDRALISYSNLIRQHFRETVPVMLGGIEASLRRVAHFDFLTGSLRRSILMDAKADFILYGMAENSILEFAFALKEKKDVSDIRGLCYFSKEMPNDAEELPSFEDCADNTTNFERMFEVFYSNSSPGKGRRLVQKHANRYVVLNPPPLPLTPDELDAVYELPFERDLHPFCAARGNVRALETIRFSITSHRGCTGECNFCSIAVHQGTGVVSRSEESIVREAATFKDHSAFKGIISDVGGPTANMYGMECRKGNACGNARRCLYPDICTNLVNDHSRQIKLLRSLRNISGIKKVFIASGIRYDLIVNDKKNGERYLAEVMENHISGQMKTAPEHTEGSVLSLMGKPGADVLRKFIDMFNRINSRLKKKVYLTYYFMAAHPGSGEREMKNLRGVINRELRLTPEQVQVFTPTPSTYSTLMYYTGKDPFSHGDVFVEKDRGRKEKQKLVLTAHQKGNRKY